MNLGFIGFGEAAFEMAKGLKGEGFGEIVAFDPLADHETYGSLIKERAGQAKVELLDLMETVIQRVNLVIVAVPADKAFEVSVKLKPQLNKEIIYVDVSASSPTVKKDIWENLKETGAAFVDAAMLGPLTVYQHKVPMIISGSGSNQFILQMSKFGMNLDHISQNPGDASAVKLTRSIFMKGTAALFIEMLEAARVLNVEDRVIASIKETMGSEIFEKVMNQLVTGTSIHAYRRSKELEGSIEMLEELNIHSSMSNASREKLLFLTDLNIKDKFQGKRPDHWTNVIDMIASTRKENVKS
ncbi:DUF1932 domain-containing protein [Metabacillus bambusae]|uniref:NAD(P)-dependent oxidoreductase n=1 Tax=Metabacillus bambusae TaxID=2795218 RepID=A0ABS3N9D2_9BACI|nr:DUF1932 domain-containing protein [Metabacillus bambusae]MBO1514906.1 NAD(P)-dependent oxidoreductase [Metabacillus bambusae]